MCTNCCKFSCRSSIDTLPLHDLRRESGSAHGANLTAFPVELADQLLLVVHPKITQLFGDFIVAEPAHLEQGRDDL